MNKGNLKKILSVIPASIIGLSSVSVFAESTTEYAENLPDIVLQAQTSIPEEAVRATIPPDILQAQELMLEAEESIDADGISSGTHDGILPADRIEQEDDGYVYDFSVDNEGETSLFTTSEVNPWKDLLAEQLGENYLAPYQKPQDGIKITEKYNKLTIEETDLTLAGKNGLNVVLKRRYDSQDYNNYYKIDAYQGNAHIDMYLYQYTNTKTNTPIYIAFNTIDEMYLMELIQHMSITRQIFR